MDSQERSNSSTNFHNTGMPIAGLHLKHQQDLENLTLASQPFKTLKLFIFAIIQYLRRSGAYLLSHGGWLMLLSAMVGVAGILLVTVDGPHEKVALGVASSIGLGKQTAMMSMAFWFIHALMGKSEHVTESASFSCELVTLSLKIQ